MQLILAFALLLTLQSIAPVLSAQRFEYCDITYSGDNRRRTVAGRIRAECPGSVHSAPWGNWGVTSNYGHKTDAQQFPGWHRGTIWGTSRPNWQWNSCTTHANFAPPNSRYYNANRHTTQRSTRGTSRHGTRVYRVKIPCRGRQFFPLPRNGCSNSDVPDSYGFSQNFMTLYELDSDHDTLIETLYFPGTEVSITNCNQHGCTGGTTAWQNVSRSTSPSARVDAEMRMEVSVKYDPVCPW